jgi:hypothetical protein
MKINLTTREVGELLSQPEWLVRRVADGLSPAFEKFGHKRLIPASRVPEIGRAIQDRQAKRRREQEPANA